MRRGGTMWWLADEPFTREVTVEWTRAEYDVETGEQIDSFSGLAVPGQWKQVGDVHYVSYVDAPEDVGGGTARVTERTADVTSAGSREQTRTTLKLEQERLTIIRFGYMQGTQVFQPGVTTSTVLTAGPIRLAVETTTTAVRTEVHPEGGAYHVEADIQVAGHQERVALTLQWSMTG